MANAATIKTVTPSISKGSDYLPGQGTTGKIPGQSISGPQPTPAQNSGKKIDLAVNSTVQIFPLGGK